MEISSSTYRKFHWSCHDPDNIYDKNIIKRLIKYVDIPSNSPKRKELKRITREFYWKSQIGVE